MSGFFNNTEIKDCILNNKNIDSIYFKSDTETDARLVWSGCGGDTLNIKNNVNPGIYNNYRIVNATSNLVIVLDNNTNSHYSIKAIKISNNDLIFGTNYQKVLSGNTQYNSTSNNAIAVNNDLIAVIYFNNNRCYLDLFKINLDTLEMTIIINNIDINISYYSNSTSYLSCYLQDIVFVDNNILIPYYYYTAWSHKARLLKLELDVNFNIISKQYALDNGNLYRENLYGMNYSIGSFNYTNMLQILPIEKNSICIAYGQNFIHKLSSSSTEFALQPTLLNKATIEGEPLTYGQFPSGGYSSSTSTGISGTMDFQKTVFNKNLLCTFYSIKTDNESITDRGNTIVNLTIHKLSDNSLNLITTKTITRWSNTSAMTNADILWLNDKKILITYYNPYLKETKLQIINIDNSGNIVPSTEYTIDNVLGKANGGYSMCSINKKTFLFMYKDDNNTIKTSLLTI